MAKFGRDQRWEEVACLDTNSLVAILKHVKDRRGKVTVDRV